MSQVSIIDIEGNHPQIPTKFNANVGFAIPIANMLEIYGATVPAGTVPVYTVGSGNNVTVNVQTSQAIASSNAANIGLSAFDSSFFTVDSNGFVSLVAGSVSEAFNVDTATLPGTDPVIPTALGIVTVTGGQVAAGTTANVIRTNSLAANTYTIQIQRSSVQAVSTIGANGVSHFNSTEFSVDANGFVSLLGGGEAIDSFTTDISGPISPSGTGNVAFTGSTNIFSDGSVANTMHLNLQGTNHTLFVGRGATTASTSLSAGSTGQILQSQGAASDPIWTTSTYPATNAQGDLIYGSAANVYSNLAKDTNATRYLSNTGTTNNPAWAQVNLANGVTGTLTVPNGGTGAISLTDHGVLVGSGTASIDALAVGTTGQLLVGITGADPAFGSSAAADFTFTSSTAGSTRLLTVSNTDNTNAASAAMIKVSTGGASAGDAQFQASTTTTSWTLGIDNSITSPTADPWVLSQGTALGTNNVMSVATSGEINYPLQPCFLANLDTNETNVTGDATTFTLGTLTPLTKIFDQNNDFNVNGTFTAPVTGKYLFTIAITITGVGVAHTACNYSLATSNLSYQCAPFSPGAIKTNVNAAGNQWSVIVDMDTADTATVTINVSGSTKTVSIRGLISTTAYTYISGQLLS